MKIGVFDSGLGGLSILKSMRDLMPEYDYVYLGDTANLPYGEKDGDQIRALTKKGVDFLFDKDCLLIVLACNTASAHALSYVQDFLKEEKDSNKRIFGMIAPTVHSALLNDRVGVLATRATTDSHMYQKEFTKQAPFIHVFEHAAPLLVPLIESGNIDEAATLLPEYLDPLLKEDIQALILGCTHYPILKKQIREKVNPHISVISQDELIPQKLKEYLEQKHTTEGLLDKNGTVTLYVTQKNSYFAEMAKKWFGEEVVLNTAVI